MLALAIMLLWLATASSHVAVTRFSRSAAASGWLLRLAAAVVLAGGVLGIAALRDAYGALALALAAAAYGSALSALARLRAQGTRWIHRFAIYTGYAATFAVMAAACLWLHERGTRAVYVAAALVACWLVGSAYTFAVKAAVVREALKTRPEYASSVANGTPGDPGYW